MKVKDVVKELLKYNQEADINVISKNTPYKFSFAYGTSEGCTKENCESVSLYLENEFNMDDIIDNCHCGNDNTEFGFCPTCDTGTRV